MFHIETQIEDHAGEITKQNKALTGLRKEQAVHDKALADARAEQAKARSSLSALEKKVKKAERSLEDKVCIFF